MNMRGLGRGHGGGGGRGSGMGRGRGMGGHGFGSTGECVCPQCGYTVSHQRGVSCMEEKCPECNIPLIRKELAEDVPAGPDNHSQRSTEFPVVNQALCTGCNACIEICPRDTIVMENNKARIIEDECLNCRVCVGVCPVKAIS